uniref:Major facilitator superfamily (MFS) profile domain-containing protein n=1 Tax=Araucaria cunninghamii TaxID=56994 RepID=A0A0D6QS57_ARACU
MAVGGVVEISKPAKNKYKAKVTPFVLGTCIVAATGGLVFGYDNGVSGGVTSMDPFLRKFFPDIYRKMHNAKDETNAYCKFDSQVLTSFTSSLQLAGLIATLFASTVTRGYGRKPSILVGGATFLTGAALNGAAANLVMLILGRVMLGIGIGFTNQAVPLYLSEMAPAHIRGAFNIGFQFCVGVGVFCASLTNYGTGKKEWGWRLSLSLAGIPAAILLLGCVWLPETPNSLMETQGPEKARAMLVKIRGTSDVEQELDDLIQARQQTVKHPFRSIMQRKYRHHLVMAVFIPMFQQLTGINAIGFYSPVIFRTIGFKSNGALLSAVFTAFVGSSATVVSMATVDKYGRRFLFLQGGLQMLICQVLLGAILGSEFESSGEGSMPRGYAYLVVVLICVYVVGFAWSWGPLGWLVPSEIFPLEIRSAGQSITVAVNLLFTFAIAQAFLAMLCYFKFGIFLFFAGWVFLMTLFVYFFLPETKNVPLEEMHSLWKKHWFWRRFAASDEVEEVEV